MTKIVAVSGGVDSVVLLDILSRNKNQRLIVAHVDHGIRPESSQDARFVEALANQYQLPFISTELNLGQNASEEAARDGRYEFLYAKSREFKAEIVTAHHQDDLVGSIAINLSRGTGWRGLAVMNRAGINRPLLGWRKKNIYDYALKHKLEWVEDDSNMSDKYLRNRLRQSINQLPVEFRDKLTDLRARQLQLVKDINREQERVLLEFSNIRHKYLSIDDTVALELLRSRFGITKPQAELALLAIKTAKPGRSHAIKKGLRLSFTKRDFIVDYHL